MFPTSPLRLPRVSAAAALLACALAAHAQTLQDYDLPAQPLGSALARIAADSGQQISIDAGLVRGRTAPPVQGSYTAEQAARAALEGSGLELVRTEGGNWALRRVAATAIDSNVDAVPSLPTVTVTATHVQETATGPVDGYVARRSATGTKSDIPIIETPQSISVVTRDQMDEQAVKTVSEALEYTAGVVTSTNGGQTRFDSVFIRGFGGFAAEAGFARYVDGLQWPQGPRNVFQIDPYALERVEVLRGPSSVLYGQATPGGFVNLISKAPTQEPRRQMMMQWGNHGYKTLGLDLSGPLNEDGSLSYRLPVLVRDADNGTRFQQEKRQMLAPSIIWRPDGATTLTVRGFYQHDPDQPDSSLLPPLSIVPLSAFRRDFYNGDPNLLFFKRTGKSLGYSFEHHFNEHWTVRQNARYDEFKTDNSLVSPSEMLDDGRTLTRYTSRFQPDARSFGVDTQLEGRFATDEVRHTLLLGLDYKKPMTSLKLGYGEAPDLDVYAPVYGTVPLEVPALTRQQRTTAEQTGLYLQDHVRVGQWAFTVGGRQDWAHSTTTISPLITGEAGDPTRQSDSKFTGRAGLVYLADNGLAPYASYSTSFEPIAGADRLGAAFKPSQGKQAEVGVRWQPTGGKTMLTASLYDLRKINVLTPDPVEPEDFDVQTGEVRSRGFELELKTELARHVNLIASLARSDVEVTKDNVPEKVGRPLMGAPKYSGSVWIDGRFVGPGASWLMTGLGVRYVGSSWGDTYDSYQMPAYKVPSYTLMDLALGYEFSKDVMLNLNIRNALNKQYVAACSYAFCYQGRGRTAVMTLRYSF